MKPTVKNRKITHKRIGEDRFTMHFRGGTLGITDRTSEKRVNTYTFFPIYDSIIGDVGQLVADQMVDLKKLILDTIPPDPKPGPGMPVVDD